MSLLRSILHGLWRGLDGLRRFLHLILLLVIYLMPTGAAGFVRAVLSRISR